LLFLCRVQFPLPARCFSTGRTAQVPGPYPIGTPIHNPPLSHSQKRAAHIPYPPQVPNGTAQANFCWLHTSAQIQWFFHSVCHLHQNISCSNHWCLPHIHSSQPPVLYTHSPTLEHPLYGHKPPRIQQAAMLRWCWNAYLVAEHLKPWKQETKTESFIVCCEAMPGLLAIQHLDT
jgi:hypothetical protein